MNDEFLKFLINYREPSMTNTIIQKANFTIKSTYTGFNVVIYQKNAWRLKFSVELNEEGWWIGTRNIGEATLSLAEIVNRALIYAEHIIDNHLPYE